MTPPITVPTEGRPTEDLCAELLMGVDGNAFAIMGETKRLLRDGGASPEYVSAYLAEAMSGDYDHLLATSAAYLEAGA